MKAQLRSKRFIRLVKVWGIFLLTLCFNHAKAQFANKNYASIMSDTSKHGVTEIYFVGTGDIQLAYNGGANSDKKIAASTGLGVLFWRLWPNGRELQLDARINVASTVDTISALEKNNSISDNRLFGRYVLVPAASGQATFVNSLWYFNRPFQNISNGEMKNYFLKGRFIDGIEIGGAASNQVWATFDKNAAGASKTIRSINASILAIRIGAFHDFVPQDLRRRGGTSIRLGVNGIVRSIQGDIGRHTDDMEALREKFTLNKYAVHYGGEILLALRLKNIRAEAALPFILTRGSTPAPGLSGAQFVTSISFVGGFPLRITGADDE